MTEGTPQAFVFPGAANQNGTSATTFLLQLLMLVGDGSSCPLQLANCFVYDATQSSAANIAAMKALVVTTAAPYFPNITTSEVILFLTVN